jgi:hypothetical protein
MNIPKIKVTDPFESLVFSRIIRAAAQYYGAEIIKDSSGKSDVHFVLFDPALEKPELSNLQCSTLFIPYRKVNQSEKKISITFLEDHLSVAPVFHGRTLVEKDVECIDISGFEQFDTILAHNERVPVWKKTVKDGIDIHIISTLLSEKYCGLPVYRIFQRERFFTAFAVFNFIRMHCHENIWQYPQSRSCITIDDPNLRSMGYGYISYRTLVRQLKNLNAHAEIATVPFDLLFYKNKKVIEFFKNNSKYISLCTHGLFHLNGDLKDNRYTSRTPVSYLKWADDVLKNFERKSGLLVSRLIVPPHELLSKDFLVAAQSIRCLGFCLGGKPNGISINLDPDDISTGLTPASWSYGMPIFLRENIEAFSNTYSDVGIQQDYLIQSFLNKPLIFCSHSFNYREKSDSLQNAAAYINSIKGVLWSDTETICQNNFALRRDGNRLNIRLFTTEAKIVVPDWCQSIRVENKPADTISVYSDENNFYKDNEVEFQIKDQRDIIIRQKLRNTEISKNTISPLLFMQAFMRRIVCEGRDRLLPILRK